MEAIFTALSAHGNITWQNIYDVERYARENEGIEMIVTIKPKARTGQKMRLYAFYHGPLLDYAVKGWRNTGEILDKVEADIRLRASFAKTFVKDARGNHIVALEEKSGMSKQRLITYVQDCIFFLESELQMEVPDSGEYKAMKATGRNMRKAGPGEEG